VVSPIRPDEDLAFAGLLADAARGAASGFFRSGLAAENKAEAGFDPGTQADRAIERALRERIAQRFPEDAIIGEEEADRPGRSGRTWILDPIDGTRAFIAGIPTWTVLIGLADETGPVLSVIDQPHIAERFFGLATDNARRAELHYHGAVTPLRTGSVKSLDTAVMTSTDAYLFEGAEFEVFSRLREQVRLARYGLDAYGYAMLALGGVDLVVESGLKPWRRGRDRERLVRPGANRNRPGPRQCDAGPARGGSGTPRAGRDLGFRLNSPVAGTAG